MQKERRLPAERPTILQIVPALETGGAELSTIEAAEAVVRAGGRALVLSEGGRLVPRLREVGGELITFPAATKNPVTILGNARRLGSIIRMEGVRLVHARSRAPAWSACIAARRADLPFVTTYHGAYSEKSRLKKFYNRVMASGDLVIANSRFTAGLIAARYGTPERKIRVIHRGVSTRYFDPALVTPERLAALRRTWGVADGARVVLHPARVSQWKGHLDVIAAADRLRSLFPDLVVAMAGDAQGRDGFVAQLEDRIAALDLLDRVKLVGHCADMPAAYAAAAVTVVASTQPEAFGRAAIEAQAMGCPVISTDIGAPPETILAEPRVARGEITGWLVPPADSEALARALSEALSLDAAARAALGERGRASVLASFRSEDMQRATLAVYDELLGTDLAARFSASH